jgi:hypothetical protein
MGKFILRAYLQFRNPKVFLFVLGAFIITSSLCHLIFGYDTDWGTTNLTLSIEASVAGAVLMMVAENSSRVQDRMAKVQQEQLAALLEMAAAERQLLTDHITILKEIRENDRLFLDHLKTCK